MNEHVAFDAGPDQEDVRDGLQREMTRRWVGVAREVKRAILLHDALGIGDKAPHLAMPTGDKAELFRRWLNERLSVGIGGYDGAWLEPFVNRASERGAGAALADAQANVAFLLPSGPSPSAKACHGATVASLAGICEDVSQRAHDSVARGLLLAARPRQIARLVDSAIGHGLKRSRALAEHSVTQAYSQATLDAMEARGVTHVGTVSERRRRLKDAYDPDEPRDPHGKWTDVGQFERDGRTVSYDKSFLELRNGELKAKRPIAAAMDVVEDQPDLMHRGMSADEYADVLRTGFIHSKGIGNVGRHERGMTFFSAEPKVAAAYTTGPDSSIGKPAYIISVRRHDASIDRLKGFELGIDASVPVKDIVAVYRGRVIEQQQRHDLKVPTPRQWHWEKLSAVHDAAPDEDDEEVIVQRPDGTLVKVVRHGDGWAVIQVGDAARKTPQPKHPRSGRFAKAHVVARESRRSKRTGRFRKQGLAAEEQRREELREARFGRVKGRLDVLTAGDDRVCDVCDEISANGPYTINKARGLVPAHPNCRCLFVAAGSMRDAGYDPNEPRTEQGMWTTGGGAGGGEAAPAAPAASLDPEVVEVGGDAWNHETAMRLEREWQAAKPEVEKAAGDLVEGGVVEVGRVEPKEWNDLDLGQQKETEQKWMEGTWENFYNQEVESWQDSGDAKREATSQLIEQFNKRDDDWALEPVKAMMKPEEGELSEWEEKGFGESPPASAEDLLNALKIEDHQDLGEPEFHWDEAKLGHAIALVRGADETPQFEGFEKVDYSKLLTAPMRQEIEARLKEKLAEAVEAYDIEPPAYLEESAKETQNQVWDEMDDSDKFASAASYLDLPSMAELKGVEVRMPKTFDPLNDTSGKDYRDTQGLAHALFQRRAEQILQARGIEPKPALIADADRELWTDWVDSSTSMGGLVLQAAAADELGGRLQAKYSGAQVEFDKDDSIGVANRSYPAMGGYAAIKALLRAKWETTQYLLEHAGKKTLDLYRTISLPKGVVFNAPKTEVRVGNLKYQQLPTVDPVRNGLASTSTYSGVANSWDGSDRVVLRLQVPRTAALSVPAYGRNVAAEKEVVIAGTAWKKWDAYWAQAPETAWVPIGATQEVK